MQDSLSSNRIAERLGGVLRAWAGNLPVTREHICRWVNIHPRNLKTYIEGQWNPPAAKIIDLAAICPAYADELVAIIAERRRSFVWAAAADRVAAVSLAAARYWLTETPLADRERTALFAAVQDVDLATWAMLQVEAVP